MALYLVWFALHPDYHKFRLQELESLAECFGVDRSQLWPRELPDYASPGAPEYERPLADDHSNSFAWVCLPDEAVALGILERSILVRGFMQVWSSAADHQGAQRILRENESVRTEFLERYIHDHVDFSWRVRSIGKKLSRPEQIARMNEYGFLFKGTEVVNLSRPSLPLGIFEDWISLGTGGEHPKVGVSKEETSKAESSLKRVYVGRIVAIQGCTEAGDQPIWWLKYSLNRRPILGPTTMDNELAFIMCNVAQVKRNDLVFDPFCGTGGILISASHLGATCLGSDLDLRVINGWFCSYVNPHMIQDKTIKKDHPRSIYSNFDYYQLKRPGIVRMDISRRSIRSSWIDAIVCDPPYGIRATSRTTSSNPSQTKDSSGKPGHYLGCGVTPPATAQTGSARNHFGALQSVDDMIAELLTFASKTLVKNGHLVFLLPLVASEYSQVISNLVQTWQHIFSIDLPYMQTLGGGLGRLLVHMQLVNKDQVPSDS
ncbi:RNA methylase [Cryptosporidium canis]|uniref:RNA methylase n=1 Tax=Cryptosporidium canis TaxID=195482 RepID=A0ABQ8P9I3_9CRYT|nr:RNA methylase [Cryptosporidium canis]